MEYTRLSDRLLVALLGRARISYAPVAVLHVSRRGYASYADDPVNSWYSPSSLSKKTSSSSSLPLLLFFRSQKNNKLVVPAGCLASARAASRRRASSIPSRRLHRFGGLDVAARNNLHTRGRRLSGVWTDKSTHAHAVPASSSRSTRWRCTPVSALAYKSAPAANPRWDRRRPVTPTRQSDD